MRIRSSFRLRPLVAALAFAVALAGPLAASAQEAGDLLAQFEDKVTTFTLDNGLTFVVVERHDAPVASFHTYADVGSVNEPVGQTGMAHMFEHMAFKGTTALGTTDIEAELDALEKEEEAYLAYRAERAKGAQADSTRLAELEAAFEATREEAKQYVEPNAFDRVLQEQGMTGMNASTWLDATRYYYSLPANKAELFFALESDRFLNPVLREFYVERDVVVEERRLRTDSSPQGRLLEEFLTTAFKAHPYGQPTIGHMSDLENISRTEAEDFFATYYGANNLTIAVVGDVDPGQIRAYADKYFGRLPAGEDPPPVTTREPEQNAERRVIMREQAQPIVIMGYQRPSMYDEDAIVYDVLADVLSRGRTSRLHRALVETEKALGAGSIGSSFPDEKYPTLFAFYGVPNRGVSPDSLEQDIYAVLDDLVENGITEDELDRARTRARADLIGSLDSNSGLAGAMSRMQALTGDWRTYFERIERLEAVTAEDVQRVARATFRPSNRTVAMIKSESDTDGGPTASAE